MDKERAIDLLDNLIGMIEDNQGNDYDTAFRMAIEALKAQLFLEGTTSDLISRQQALDIFDDYNVSVENGELEAYSRDRKRLCDLPPIQPETPCYLGSPCEYQNPDVVISQPEPAIPVAWIEKHIEWLKSLDNEFANLAAAHISVMLKKWRGEQHETD